MPRQEAVDESEAHPGDPNREPVTAWRLLAKPVAEAVRRAGAIGFFPDPVHVAERSELLGCVPGIERELVDEPLHRSSLRELDVLLRHGQGCHQDRPRDLLLPAAGKILDRCLPLTDEGLQVDIEFDVTALEPCYNLFAQMIRVRWLRLGRRRSVRSRTQEIAHGSGVAP